MKMVQNKRILNYVNEYSVTFLKRNVRRRGKSTNESYI